VTANGVAGIADLVQTSPNLMRDAILEEAAQLFATEGYRKTRLEEVSTKLRVTRAAIYYHFKNKQEILFHIHLRAIKGLLAGAEAILANPEPLDVQFGKLLRHHVAYVARNATYIGIFHEEEVELSPAQREEVNILRRRYADKLIGIYADAVKLGLVRNADPRLAIFTLLGACNWVYRWYRQRGSLSAEAVGEFIGDILARGYLATDRAPLTGQSVVK
jgi:AcrR family transcriptional regulator